MNAFDYPEEYEFTDSRDDKAKEPAKKCPDTLEDLEADCPGGCPSDCLNCETIFRNIAQMKIVKDLKSPVGEKALSSNISPLRGNHAIGSKAGFSSPIDKTVREIFFDAVDTERTRQDKIHGGGKPQSHTLSDWNMILGEEKGERIGEENEVHFRNKKIDQLLEELVHEAAVALAIYEALIEGRVRTYDDSTKGESG